MNGLPVQIWHIEYETTISQNKHNLRAMFECGGLEQR